MTNMQDVLRIPAGRAGLKRDVAAERTRRDILQAATQEFAARGFGGARLDAIADQMQTTKAMVYYYFASKEGLYKAVVEDVFDAIRKAELERRSDQGRDAEVELRSFVEATFAFHEEHPVYSRIVSMENLNDARVVGQLPQVKGSPVVRTLGSILARGAASGQFRAGIDAVDLHYFISALCVFRVTNRMTFREIFDRDLADPAVRARHLQMVIDGALGVVAPGAVAGAASAFAGGLGAVAD
jgi:AcrR family transcriptional regulator